MTRINVFCGSRDGKHDAFRNAAQWIGEELGRRSIGLVYGGASVGTMGVIADAALAAGAEVIGVTPRSLDRRERTHTGLTEQRFVETMAERKQLMAELSDAFLVLPGGLGTLDELFEVLTANQLGTHRKPVGLLNVAGYFDGLLQFLDRGLAEGFIAPEHREMLLVDDDPGQLLSALMPERTEPAAS